MAGVKGCVLCLSSPSHHYREIYENFYVNRLSTVHPGCWTPLPSMKGIKDGGGGNQIVQDILWYSRAAISWSRACPETFQFWMMKSSIGWSKQFRRARVPVEFIRLEHKAESPKLQNVNLHRTTAWHCVQKQEEHFPLWKMYKLDHRDMPKWSCCYTSAHSHGPSSGQGVATALCSAELTLHPLCLESSFHWESSGFSTEAVQMLFSLPCLKWGQMSVLTSRQKKDSVLGDNCDQYAQR